jgi:chromate reductase
MTKIVSISGSLRKASLNTALLHSAAELAPDGTVLTFAPIADIPLYNGDLDVDGGPGPVQKLMGSSLRLRSTTTVFWEC